MQSIKIGEKQKRILVIAVFVVVVGGWVYASFSDLRTVVSAKYPDQIAVLIGARNTWSSSDSGPSSVERCSYILVPSVFTSPVVISVKRVNGGTPTLREEPMSPWFIVVAIGFILFGIAVNKRNRNA